MVADGTATTEPHQRGRPDLTTLPKPTTGRVVVLLTALLAIGVTVGNLAHSTIFGDEWVAVLSRCSQEAAEDVPSVDMFATNEVMQGCLIPAERVRAGFMAGGALAVVIGSVGFVYVAPVLVRRRRGLREAGPKLAPVVAKVGELATAHGGRVVPRIALGASQQRDAFCFGPPGRPVLVLPPALAVRYRDAELFDPVVRHELAHVQHRDVPLAWLARGFLLVAGLIALVPVLTAAVTGDRSVLPDFLWRVAILVGAGWLVARSVLRIREHDADLAADTFGGGSLARLLDGGLMLDTPTGWRRWGAHHPSAQERVRVLREPEQVALVAFAGGLWPGFFAAVAVPSVVAMTSVMLTGTGRSLQAYGLAAAVGGLVLAGSVGVDIYRSATVEAAGGRRRILRDTSVTAGVGIGVLTGQLITPASAWTGFALGLPLWAVPIPAVLVAGATAMLCGAARSLAGRRLHPTLLVLPAAALFGVSLWSGLTLQLPANVGMEYLQLTLLYGQGLLPSTAAALLVVMAGVAVRGRAALRDLRVGALAGATAGGLLVTVRLLSAPAETDAEKVAVYLLTLETAVFAALAAAVVLSFVSGTRGALSGLVALPAAVATTLVAFLLLNAARGGTTDLAFVDSLLRPALFIGFLAVVTAGLVGLVPRRGRGEGSRSVLATVPVALVAVASTALAGPFLLLDSGTFISFMSTVDPLDVAPEDPDRSAGPGDAVEPDAAQYSESLASAFNDQLLLLVYLADHTAQQPADPAMADELDAQVVGLLDQFAWQVGSVRPLEPDVAEAHQELIETIELTRAYVGQLLEYHRRGDATALETAMEHRRLADLAYLRWVDGVAGLG
jgi:Zn-dependent protease with chaperone function